MGKQGVGLIGCGFMGRAHSDGYRRVNAIFPKADKVELVVCCQRNLGAARTFAEQWGYRSAVDDWRAVVSNPDVTIVDICTPNDTHREIALAAAKAGKKVFCEKPLARTVEEGKEMADAANEAGVQTMVWFCYRFLAALLLAKMLIANGRLGRIYHVFSTFLQDWTMSPDLPQGGAGLWRLDVAASGSGVSGDLLAHNIDLVEWLTGLQIADLVAMTDTFITERKHNLTGKVEKVGIDDACQFMGHFDNKGQFLFASTRYARGNKAKFDLEINGEKGAIRWNLHTLQYLEFYDHETPGPCRGWTQMHVTDGSHPTMAKWWVPGLAVGYDSAFTNQIAAALGGFDEQARAGLGSDRLYPTFDDALRTQQVLAAVLKSASERQWVTVE